MSISTEETIVLEVQSQAVTFLGLISKGGKHRDKREKPDPEEVKKKPSAWAGA